MLFSMQLPSHFPNSLMRKALCSQFYTMDWFCSLFVVMQLVTDSCWNWSPRCSPPFSAIGVSGGQEATREAQ